MSLPVSVPYAFANATTTQNLSSLDSNFNALANGLNGLANGSSQISVSSISATGTANSNTYLRGDGAWATVSGGGSDVTYANVTVTQNLVPPSSFLRNRIINGAMMIDQRNAGASVTPTDAFTLDRWISNTNSVAGKFSVQQNAGSVTPPAGFKNYLGVTSLSAYTVGAAEYFLQSQYIEGFNVSDLNWGTVNALTITLSFWVSSSLTGTFGGALNNNAGNRSYPFTYTISAANTWEYKTITIAGDTSGTWTTDNTRGISLRFGLGVGSTFSGTAGSWSGSTYYSATGATSVVGTNGATFYITGVQLEVGTVSTPFERRQYGTELMLCQRYYEKSYNNSVSPGSSVGGGTGQLFVNAIASASTIIGVNYAVSKRTSPTVTTYDNAGTSGKNSYYVSSWNNGANATVNTSLEKGFNVTLTGTGSLIYLNCDWASSAEL